MSNYLGIDIGTGSCKATIIDSSGTVHGIGSHSYFSDSQSIHWKEQNPDAIVDGMIGAVKDVLSKTDQSLLNFKTVSLGCALHGIMAVDKEGNPLTNLYTWADDRAEPQASRVKTSSDYFELYRQTGCPAHGMYPLYKIMWIRENLPQVFSRTDKFISIKEYILQKLCGDYLIDFSVASGSGLFNVHSHQWNPRSLKLAGIDRQHLSAVASPWMMKAITSPSMAEKLGLPLHTPIVLGASDAANSSLGAGAFSNTQATCMIGTSGAYRIISPEPLLHPNASSWCYCVDDSYWLVGGAINNGGSALSWLKDALQNLFPDELTFTDLLNHAAQCDPGADGLFCLPFFLGERSPNWDLEARAVFVGLSQEHDIRHLSRAILEGIAFRMRSMDAMLSTMVPDLQEVRASGGFTQSDFWVQLIADVLGRPISVPAEGETSCLGASFWAYLADHPGEDFNDLSKFVHVSKIFHPQPVQKEHYDKMYNVYLNIYHAISPLFRQISDFRLQSTAQ